MNNLQEGAQKDITLHENLQHVSTQMHHHHTHTSDSMHTDGHHLLQVEHLSISFERYASQGSFFASEREQVHSARDLSVSVHAGEILAVVGASGSGKTLLADSILGLFEPNATVRGRIWFDGKPQTAETLAQLRGHGISLVPQSVNYLDPLMRVGNQVQGWCSSAANRAERERKQQELFKRYGLDLSVANLYPHELSGGMARRVLLCCALMDNPKLIIADEPTPGMSLDLAVRAMDDFRFFADAGGGVMLITHDVELALRVADRVAVFKDGTVVEETAADNFSSEETLQHPFSKALWRAVHAWDKGGESHA